MMAFTADKKISIGACVSNETIDSQRYVTFVRNTGNRWRSLRSKPTKLSQIVCQHDNARPHTAAITKSYFQKREIEQLWQSPYSPDLNFLDRWINKAVKKELRKCNFKTADEVRDMALQVMRSIPESRYVDELKRLLPDCQLIIDNNGDYI